MRRRSVRVVSLALVTAVALLAPPTALTQPQQQRPEGQIPDRGRPTESGDEIPFFDYDAYFPGTWEFEWRVPESPRSASSRGPTPGSPGPPGAPPRECWRPRRPMSQPR